MLTGKVVLNPEPDLMAEGHVDFIMEVLVIIRKMLRPGRDEQEDEFEDEEEEEETEDVVDKGGLSIKLCVLGTPGRQGKQKLGTEEVCIFLKTRLRKIIQIWMLYLCFVKLGDTQWRDEFPTSTCINQHM